MVAGTGAGSPAGLPRDRDGRRLRILLAIDSLDPGGAERHTAGLAIALAARGHDVTVACSTAGELATALEAHAVAVVELLDGVIKRRVSLDYAEALARLVRRRRFDVVDAHLFASGVAAATAVDGAGPALVLTEHTEAPWRSDADRSASRFAYRHAGHVVAVTSAIARQLMGGYGVPADRLTVVPPARPPELHSVEPVAQPEPFRSRGGPIVGRVARLQPEKGLDVFLRAATVVARRVPDARFVVVGDGPLGAPLERLVSELGLLCRAHLTGYRPDAARLIARLDVLVVSSLSDGAPLVVLEALDAGVPVVASAVGGLPDQLDHGRAGVLVPPGDPRALGSAVAELLGDGVRRRRLAAAGRRRGLDFVHAEMVSRVESLYARLAAR